MAESRARRQWLGHATALTASMALPGLMGGCGRRGPADGLTVLRPDVSGQWIGANAERGHAWRDGRLPIGVCGEPQRVHTLIIGAGVAGLSAAHALIQAGLDDLAVLDIEDQPGGNARGHQMQGLPCPLGAHYLPMPGPDAVEVAQWLEEIGLIRHEHGRWVGDERHLCHSPQERLFVPDDAAQQVGGAPSMPASAATTPFWRGQCHEGLLPMHALSKEDLAQYRRFSQDVDSFGRALGFAMPTSRRPWHAGLQALDQITLAQWLDQRGYTSRSLRWLLDYACRDDYGAGMRRVSAWAGLHYFASRHGFEPPGQPGEPNEPNEPREPRDAVLTWPQGNGWLTQRLASDLGSRWQAGQVAVQVEAGRHEVQVQAWSGRRGCMQGWRARQVILAVPLFIAQRLLKTPVPALAAIAPRMAYAPWLVSNVLLDQPFFDRPGAPLAWDNVAYTEQGVADVPVPALGYVDARHQSLAPPTGPMLLTHYWALGGQDAAQAKASRHALLQGSWRDWAGRVAADLARVHPDLPGQVRQVDLARYGHAMSIPVPGLRGHAALASLSTPQGRLHFAHSDLSAYSVFEEAFTHGVRAASQVLSASGMARRMA